MDPSFQSLGVSKYPVIAPSNDQPQTRPKPTDGSFYRCQYGINRLKNERARRAAQKLAAEQLADSQNSQSSGSGTDDGYTQPSTYTQPQPYQPQSRVVAHAKPQPYTRSSVPAPMPTWQAENQPQPRAYQAKTEDQVPAYQTKVQPLSRVPAWQAEKQLEAEDPYAGWRDRKRFSLASEYKRICQQDEMRDTLRKLSRCMTPPAEKAIKIEEPIEEHIQEAIVVREFDTTDLVETIEIDSENEKAPLEVELPNVPEEIQPVEVVSSEKAPIEVEVSNAANEVETETIEIVSEDEKAPVEIEHPTTPATSPDMNSEHTDLVDTGMDQRLRTTWQSIHDARQGIERLEEKVSSTTQVSSHIFTTLPANSTPLYTLVAAHPNTLLLAPHPCICDANSSHFRVAVDIKFPIKMPSINTNWREWSWIAFLLMLFLGWLLLESSICGVYCKPKYTSRASWRASDPLFPYALPYKFDEWTGSVVSRAWRDYWNY